MRCLRLLVLAALLAAPSVGWAHAPGTCPYCGMDLVRMEPAPTAPVDPAAEAPDGESPAAEAPGAPKRAALIPGLPDTLFYAMGLSLLGMSFALFALFDRRGPRPLPARDRRRPVRRSGARAQPRARAHLNDLVHRLPLADDRRGDCAQETRPAVAQGLSQPLARDGPVRPPDLARAGVRRDGITLAHRRARPWHHRRGDRLDDGIRIAHKAARSLYADGRQATLTQLPLMAVMMLFSFQSLWLLNQPMLMRTAM